jgi:hypothetical protein
VFYSLSADLVLISIVLSPPQPSNGCSYFSLAEVVRVELKALKGHASACVLFFGDSSRVEGSRESHVFIHVPFIGALGKVGGSHVSHAHIILFWCLYRFMQPIPCCMPNV